MEALLADNFQGKEHFKRLISAQSNFPSERHCQNKRFVMSDILLKFKATFSLINNTFSVRLANRTEWRQAFIMTEGCEKSAYGVPKLYLKFASKNSLYKMGIVF